MTVRNGGGGGGGGGGKNAEAGKDSNGYCGHKETPEAAAAEPEEKTLLTSERV